MTFKDRLKSLRKSKHLTQGALAAVLNYGATAISNYESGRNEPSIEDLKKIAHYFDVSTDYLLCVTDIKTPFNADRDNKQITYIESFLYKLSQENLNSAENFITYLYSVQKSDKSNFQKAAEPQKPYKQEKN